MWIMIVISVIAVVLFLVLLHRGKNSKAATASSALRTNEQSPGSSKTSKQINDPVNLGRASKVPGPPQIPATSSQTKTPGLYNLEYLSLSEIPLAQLPEQLSRENYNPNDLLGLADFLLYDHLNDVPAAGEFLAPNFPNELSERFQRVEILSKFGIESLEKNPAELAHNINLGLAYYKLASVLIGFNEIGEAKKRLASALSSGHETASMGTLYRAVVKLTGST